MLFLAQVGPVLPRPFGYSFVADRSVGYRDSQRVEVHVFDPSIVVEPAQRDELSWTFLSRARALLGLVGNGLLTTLAVETVPGPRWITEHRPGERLDALRPRMLRGAVLLDVAGALSVASDLLAGLALLHDQADVDRAPLLHGDPSLAAVLLDGNGRALLDPLSAFRWGAGSAFDPNESPDGPTSSRFQHLSPARICGDPPSVADEIFAIGSILGALLIGQPVFRGDSEMVTLRKIMEADTGRFEKLARHVPDAIVEVVRVAVQRKPERRFPSARAFAEELERAAQHARLTPSPTAVVRWLSSLAALPV